MSVQFTLPVLFVPLVGRYFLGQSSEGHARLILLLFEQIGKESYVYFQFFCCISSNPFCLLLVPLISLQMERYRISKRVFLLSFHCLFLVYSKNDVEYCGDLFIYGEKRLVRSHPIQNPLPKNVHSFL